MIIVKLKGGLGNQLFQYATGRALVLRQSRHTSKETSLKLDLESISKNNGHDTVRYYALSPFDIKAELATDNDISSLSNRYKILSKLFQFIRTKIFRQFYISFVSRIFNMRGDCYLDGFFQSEKYFTDEEVAIRKDLLLKVPMGNKMREIYTILKEDSSSVSIHIRRGDVAINAKTNPYYGICTVQYYNDSISYIGQILTKPHFYIFSDDIEWVKSNINIPDNSIFISDPSINDKIKDYEELILMSHCKHNIIANSSFSWWGAWLNENPDKIIIAPKKWITRSEFQHKDTVPPSWIRI